MRNKDTFIDRHGIISILSDLETLLDNYSQIV